MLCTAAMQYFPNVFLVTNADISVVCNLVKDTIELFANPLIGFLLRNPPIVAC
jgi:hypothetical protein